MKKYLLTMVIIFFACISALNAQEQNEKKVHLKIIKEENGKVTEIDTVFEVTNFEEIHFNGDISIDELKIDSILKEFKIEDHKGMKFITLSDEIHTHDSLKHIWLTVDADMEGDSVKMKKHVYFSKDGDKKLIEQKERVVWIASDSCEIIKEFITDGEHNEHVMVHGDGKKMKVITISDEFHTDDSIKHVWHTIDADVEGDSVKMKKIIYLTEDGKKVKVIHGKSGDSTYDIIKSESGDNTTVKEVIVKELDDNEKTIEIYVTTDGDDINVKIKDIEGEFEHANENVKIYKYKTDDGNIMIKAEIDSDDGDKKVVKKEFEKIKISPNPTDGKFKLEFELSNKESVVVQVNNESGKSVYSKKVKKFTGTFSEEIDISKEESGTYYILITQGDKTIKNKIQKK